MTLDRYVNLETFVVRRVRDAHIARAAKQPMTVAFFARETRRSHRMMTGNTIKAKSIRELPAPKTAQSAILKMVSLRDASILE